MGYTHYWKSSKQMTQNEIDEIYIGKVIPLVRKVLSYHKSILDVESYANGREIFFNGIEDDGHETFYFKAGEVLDFEFCKTARKPYDIVVLKVLTILHTYIPTFNASSDGSWREWKVISRWASRNGLVMPIR